VVVLNPRRLARAARPRPRAVVLQTAHHVVERLPVVGVNLVELPCGEVVDDLPVLAAVHRDGDAAVLPLPHTLRVLRVEPEGVEVDVRAPADWSKCAPAVNGKKQSRGDGEDAVLVLRVNADVRVIEAARDDWGLLRDVMPRLSA